MFWSSSQVAKTGIYSGIFSSVGVIAGFGGGEGKSKMICLNHITTLHHWGFPSHPLIYLHILHSPFFPKITNNAETKHDSCCYLKNTPCLECSISFLHPKHSLYSILLLKHFVLVLSLLIFSFIFPFSFLGESYLLESWMSLDLCWKEVNCCRCPNLPEPDTSLQARVGKKFHISPFLLLQWTHVNGVCLQYKKDPENSQHLLLLFGLC